MPGGLGLAVSRIVDSGRGEGGRVRGGVLGVVAGEGERVRGGVSGMVVGKGVIVI